MKPLSVIITTHNRLDYTRQTIESLFATVPADTKFFIFDNASDKETQDYLSSVCGSTRFNLHLIHSAENLGWGASVNKMLELVDTEMILVSNNDVVYHEGWYEKALALYEKYPKIGVFGLWKHVSHGVLEDKGDLIVKDQMPAVSWLFKRSVMNDIGPIPVHGPCATKGGNGEDVGYCIMAANKGYLVCGPKDDLSRHLDGY